MTRCSAVCPATTAVLHLAQLAVSSGNVAGNQRDNRATRRRRKETMSQPDPSYRVTLEPLPSTVPPHVRLKLLLKQALRQHALKCTKLEQLPAEPPGRPDSRPGPAEGG